MIQPGKTDRGSQRYLCQNEACDQSSFLLNSRYQGYRFESKREVVDMAMNGSGMRDTARVLGISTGTVLSELKRKRLALEPVNRPFLDRLADPDRPTVEAYVEETEVDEMWDFVDKKKTQRGLWQVLDHRTETSWPFDRPKERRSGPNHGARALRRGWTPP
ncbi:MAG TPA: IS1-like element transposase [Candidatus Competibacteraceae bacterium]|nr:IS1-like element transposase [Candidatus Competibacteraceae bacterium]